MWKYIVGTVAFGSIAYGVIIIILGATLVLACRNINKGIILKQEILAQNYNRQLQVYVKHLDLTSFDSIIKFAECINTEFNEIYALVNNAGIFYYPQELTVDGFDVTLQTNYLGMNS
ncbi:retinol dehydrogenase [Holotrichia oblita]|uniref:Retinol dehydrogenase n=1 Tax=Holotrichia oblita TaxID=644536 RepID=A0ACB9TN91_HOLOL|nr:retinol dehydrogenase [Holotrichia oblita]